MSLSPDRDARLDRAITSVDDGRARVVLLALSPSGYSGKIDPPLGQRQQQPPISSGRDKRTILVTFKRVNSFARTYVYARRRTFARDARDSIDLCAC